MPVTRQRANDAMTPESIQAMIDRAIQRNSTQDDGSQSLGGGIRRAALTWWEGHVRTLCHDAAYAMTWGTFKKKLMDKYCPNGEILKLKIELWNLKVRGNDVTAYTQHFQELALIPRHLDFAIELANDLMDQKLHTYSERQNENKRKVDDSSRNNHQQQPLRSKM
ncbi:reverse transcriptase domain-containing protein [Tanacetum coccineum]|uniref:Reverse transcriptase domain-containing protein n=1 Tax=Tanacetum coccineum TaxID=301880 RepID=A0ABQ5DGM4_9ASTR